MHTYPQAPLSPFHSLLFIPHTYAHTTHSPHMCVHSLFTLNALYMHAHTHANTRRHTQCILTCLSHTHTHTHSHHTILFHLHHHLPNTLEQTHIYKHTHSFLQT